MPRKKAEFVFAQLSIKVPDEQLAWIKSRPISAGETIRGWIADAMAGEDDSRISVPTSMLEKYRALAAERGAYLDETIRMALVDYMERHEKLLPRPGRSGQRAAAQQGQAHIPLDFTKAA